MCSISNSEVIYEKYRPGKRHFFLLRLDLEGQQSTKTGKLVHFWIRNVSSYPLVFVVNLYFNQERDGSGMASPRSVLGW